MPEDSFSEKKLKNNEFNLKEAVVHLKIRNNSNQEVNDVKFSFGTKHYVPKYILRLKKGYFYEAGTPYELARHPRNEYKLGKFDPSESDDLFLWCKFRENYGSFPLRPSNSFPLRPSNFDPEIVSKECIDQMDMKIINAGEGGLGTIKSYFR